MAGRCESGACACDIGWTGERCERVNFGDSFACGQGGLCLNGSRNFTATWGGEAVAADDGTWHLYAAGFDGNRGLESWLECGHQREYTRDLLIPRAQPADWDTATSNLVAGTAACCTRRQPRRRGRTRSRTWRSARATARGTARRSTTPRRCARRTAPTSSSTWARRHRTSSRAAGCCPESTAATHARWAPPPARTRRCACSVSASRRPPRPTGLGDAGGCRCCLRGPRAHGMTSSRRTRRRTPLPTARCCLSTRRARARTRA